jgi:FkbM family methyltransferase
MSRCTELRFALTRLAFHVLRARVRINGDVFRIPRELLPVLSLRRNNVYEPDHIGLMRRLLRPGDGFVDVGANIGVLSVAAGLKVGATGSIVAYEPNPFIFLLLTKMLSLNGLSANGVARPVAIGEHEGQIDFYASAELSPVMPCSGTLQHGGGAEKIKVPSVTLDGDLASRRVDWIKIDVEGAELSVLRGAVKTIDGHRPVVSVEVHGMYFPDKAEVVAPVFDFFRQRHDYFCWNLAKRAPETDVGFMNDSGNRDIDPRTGRRYSEAGYGHLIFAPSRRRGEMDAALGRPPS